MKLLAELGQEFYRCKDCGTWLPTWQEKERDPSCAGFSHEGHNVITKIGREQREITALGVTFVCKKCGEDATFRAASDFTKNGVLVCTEVSWKPEHNHTIKEAL